MGLLAGVAFSEDGVARGAMGIDAGDYDHSGHPSVVIGNFSNEMVTPVTTKEAASSSTRPPLPALDRRVC